MKNAMKAVLEAILAGAIIALPMKAKADTATNLTLNMTNNAVLTWNWVEQYQLESTAGTGGSITGSTNGWYDANSPINLTAVPGRDYSFSGWSGDTNTLKNPLKTAMNDKCNITANFEIRKTANGIPFDWFRGYGYTEELDDSFELGDEDSDGFNNLEEYISDTNPKDENSYFQPLFIEPGAENKARLSIEQTSAKRKYTIYGRNNMLSGSWSEMTNSPGNGSKLVFEMNKDTRSKLYKAGVRKE